MGEAAALAGVQEYGLCVFADEKSAFEFASKGNPNVEVWLCEAEGVREPNVSWAFPGYLQDGFLNVLNIPLSWVPGTLMADRVKLVEKLSTRPAHKISHANCA